MNEELRAKELRDERGIALILAMLILLVVTLIGISAVNTTIYDNLIAGNKRASEEAFYVAEAGINEFMGRFREDATFKISDNDPTNPLWKLLLAKNLGKGATKIGYASGDPNSIQSLQSQLDFGVEIRHKIDSSSPANVITYSGVPIYILKSHGFTLDGGNKVIEVEIKKAIDLDPPSSIYSKNSVNVQGGSIYIQGNDQCGKDDKYGIITTSDNVEINGKPTIDGIPTGNPYSIITNSPIDSDLQGTINNLKGNVNYSFNYTSDQTLTGYSDSWGIPTFNEQNATEKPLTYTGPMNIVYFNMNGKKLKLAGGCHGAGILLVDGHLELHGGFSWYGVIIVTGALDYTGGGEKNVTGGILGGDSTTVKIEVGGNAGILYCSEAVKRSKKSIPFKTTRWREIF